MEYSADIKDLFCLFHNMEIGKRDETVQFTATHPKVFICWPVLRCVYASFFLTSYSPLALLPPGKAPVTGWAQPSALKVEMVFFGVGVGAGCGGRTESNKDTRGTGMAVAQIPQFAEPTGRQGKEDRPPQTQAGTAFWPACVLQRFGGGCGW